MELLKRYKNSQYLIFATSADCNLTDGDIEKGQIKEYVTEAKAGDRVVFRIGIYALRCDINDVTLTFNALKQKTNTIPPQFFIFLNRDKKFTVSEGELRYMWIMCKIPEECKKGKYEGIIQIKPAGEKSAPVKLCITLGQKSSDSVYKNAEYLNSQIACDEDVVKNVDISLLLSGNKITFGSGELTLSRCGLPQEFIIGDKNVLLSPARLIVMTRNGELKPLGEKVKVAKQTPQTIVRRTNYGGGQLSFTNEIRFDFTAVAEFKITISSGQLASCEDIYVDCSCDDSVIVDGNLSYGAKDFGKGESVEIVFSLIPKKELAEHEDKCDIMFDFDDMPKSLCEYKVFCDCRDEDFTIRYYNYLLEMLARTLCDGEKKAICVRNIHPLCDISRLYKVVKRANPSNVLVLDDKETKPHLLPFFDKCAK